jgi:RND family efflux transporter MFP subunit
VIIRRSILLASLYALIFALGCKGHQSEQASPPIAVTVRAVSQAEEPRSKVYSASFQPNREVAVAFQVSGYVDAIKQTSGADGRTRDIQQGDSVKAHELLASVRSDLYMAQVTQLASALTSAEAAEARSARDFDRDSQLFDKHIIAESEYDYAQQQYRTAQAQVNQSRAALRQVQINLGYCKLIAPMDGVILARSIEVGSLAEPNVLAFRLADTNEMKAVFGVSDIEVAGFKAGQTETLVSDALPGKRITGKITRIDPEADPTTRVFDVEVTVPNSDGRVRSGMIATLDVAQPSLPGAEPSTLPLAAIVRSPQNPQELAVYVAEDQSGRTIARLRRVNLGPIVGNEIAVSSGVRTGEQVIIRGATMVTDGSEVRVIP